MVHFMSYSLCLSFSLDQLYQNGREWQPILDRIGQPLAWERPAFRRLAPLAPSWNTEPLVGDQVRSDRRGLAGLQIVIRTPSEVRYWSWILRFIVFPFQYGWIMAEVLGFGNLILHRKDGVLL